VARPGLGDRLPVALDRVLEPEARPAELAAAGVDRELVVEAHRPHVPDVDLGGRRLDAGVPKPLVAAVEPAEVLDPRGLEPDEVRGVVGDALRVRLGEADGDVELEAVAVDGETLWRRVRRSGCSLSGCAAHFEARTQGAPE
jgi:hypothetical protein